MCEKLDIGLREQKFFQDKESFFKNFDYNKNFKNEIWDLKKKHSIRQYSTGNTA